MADVEPLKPSNTDWLIANMVAEPFLNRSTFYGRGSPAAGDARMSKSLQN
ncbi:hypothetical protein SAMN05216344_12461 [Polaromonas sp. OV174]|nr:hypothetical protein SAMN05216344_12461 [Polaromonas sp. OV174]